MADYKVIGTKRGYVRNGSLTSGALVDSDVTWYEGHSVKSSFFRPTQTSYGARYLGCDFYVSLAVTNDMSVWISSDGGQIKTTNMPNGGTYYGWPKSFLAASLNDFSVAPHTDSADLFTLLVNGAETDISYNDPWSIGEGQSWSGVSVFQTNFGLYCPLSGGDCYACTPVWSDPKEYPANSYAGIPTAQDVSSVSVSGSWYDLKSAMHARGFEYVGQLTDSWVTSNGTEYGGWVYISGLCLFNSSVPNSRAFTSAAKVWVQGLEEFLDYYPWARIVGGEWRSHNRQGGSLKRYNNGWKDIKNSVGSGASKGFRHNGSTWAKSPKTGRE